MGDLEQLLNELKTSPNDNDDHEAFFHALAAACQAAADERAKIQATLKSLVGHPYARASSELEGAAAEAAAYLSCGVTMTGLEALEGVQAQVREVVDTH